MPISDKERDAVTLMEFEMRLRQTGLGEWRRKQLYSILQDALRESAEWKEMTERARNLS